MGRPERHLEASAGPICAFALRLRELRRQAGSPGYRNLARATSFSVSTLSEAAGGQRLPTLEVTLAFAQACGGDRETWQRLWDQARAALTAQEQPAEPPAPALPPGPAGQEPPAAPGSPAPAGRAEEPEEPRPAPTPRNRPRGRLVERLALVLAGGLLGTAATLAWDATASAHHTTAPAAAAPTRHLPDDTDPSDSGCDHTGAQSNAATANLYYGTDRYVLGQIVLRHSGGCGTAWARFDPIVVIMNRFAPHATITIGLQRRSDGKKLSYTSDYVGVGAYGNMLNPDGSCLQATVTATNPGQPPHTASTICLAP